MKTLIIAVLTLINTNAFAQKKEAFFYSDSAGIKNIANLIIENTKKTYHLDKIIPHKSNIEFWYRYDPHTLITIHFQIFPDTSTRLFFLKALTGNYEDIFPFWKKYFQEDADSSVTEKAGGAKSSAISFLKSEIIYRFHKAGNPIWQITPYSLVNPIKK